MSAKYLIFIEAGNHDGVKDRHDQPPAAEGIEKR